MKILINNLLMFEKFLVADSFKVILHSQALAIIL